MFTGIVAELGTVSATEPLDGGIRLVIDATSTLAGLEVGDSVAVNGVCLTVVSHTDASFTVQVVDESLARSALGSVGVGSPLNLERPLAADGRFDGHIVQGHVDGVVRVLTIRPEGGFQNWRFSLPAEHAQEVASKGSVALNGVSLTVADLGRDWFEVALIPTTLEATSLGGLRTGAELHLETDVLAKYVARRLGGSSPSAIDQMFGGGNGA
jgi:riboflavin synthase